MSLEEILQLQTQKTPRPFQIFRIILSSKVFAVFEVGMTITALQRTDRCTCWSHLSEGKVGFRVGGGPCHLVD